MAVDNPPAFLQAGSYSASRDRLHLVSARHVPTTLNTTDAACRGGILGGGAGRQANFNMTGWDVTVGRFIAVVENTFASQPGDYQVLNMASQVLTVTASSPTTNRIDIIGVRVQDAFYSGVLNQADLVVVQGTPAAGTPSAPTLPASFLPIVQVTVNANTSTGILADLRKRTGAMGSVYAPFTGQLADAGTMVGEAQLMPAAAPYPARVRVWDGTTWRGTTSYAFAMPAQTGSGTLPAGSAVGAVIVALAVPDPGYPYKLDVSGSMGWGVVPPSTVAHNMWFTTTLDSTTYNVGRISSTFVVATPGLAGNSSQTSARVTPSHTAELTGSHTVRLMARNNHASDSYTIPAASVETRLQVVVVPT